MPILKYFVVVGLALVGLIFAFESLMVSPQASDQKVAAASTSRSSIDLLRAMSHHGETKSTSLADAGVMRPMPVAPTAASKVVAEVSDAPAMAPIVPAPASVAKSSALDAQAKIASAEILTPPPAVAKAKPAKKKVAARKPPQNRYPDDARRYVEITPRGPFEFFGMTQSW